MGNTFESIEKPEWKFQVIIFILRKTAHLKEIRAKFLPENESKYGCQEFPLQQKMGWE